MSYPAILLLHEQKQRERAEQADLDLNLLLTAMSTLGKGGEKSVRNMFDQLDTMMADRAADEDTPETFAARRDRMTALLLQIGAGSKS